MGFDFGQFKNIGALKEVWEKMPDKSWTGFLEAIGRVRNEKNGSDETLDKAEEKAKWALREGKGFPSNPADLTAFLGSH